MAKAKPPKNSAPAAKPLAKPAEPVKVLKPVKPVTKPEAPAAHKPLSPAKKPPKAKTGTIQDVKATRSFLLQSTITAARTEYGDKTIAVIGDAGNLIMGIPIPFAMQYVLQNNIWPLSRMVQLVGVEKSNKSSLTFEVARWFSLVDGITYLVENETKFAVDLAEAVAGYANELGYDAIGVLSSASGEDWQKKLQFITTQTKQRMQVGDKAAGIKPIGRTVPILQILDSLAGSLSEEIIGKIDKRGYAGREFAIEAMSNTSFLKKYRADLAGWPFALLVVNHLKKQKAETGNHIERRKPGGKHVGFQESLELEMSKVSALKYVDDREGAFAMDIRGNKIKIACKRSSMGEEDREIIVDFLWWYDRSPVTGLPQQYARWNWEAATVDLLTSVESGSRKTKVTDIVNITKINNNSFHCKQLGVSKDDPVTAQEMGVLLEKDTKIMAQLADLFAIKQRTVFRSGMDYRKLLTQQADAVKRTM